MVKNLTEGKPLPLLFFFALPMVAGNLFQQLYNIMDTWVVGRFLGENAVAAVGSSFPIVFLSIAVTTGLSMGANVVVSQLFGAGRIREMKSTVSTALISMGMLGVAVTILAQLVSFPLLRLLGTNQDVFADALIYLRVYFCGVIFLFLFNALNGIYNALGNSRTPMLFLMMSTLLNIALDLMFVVWFHMGVAGVAWATVIAQGFCAILSLIVLLVRLRRLPDEEDAPTGKRPIFQRQAVGRIARIGLPSMLQQSLVSLSMLLMQNLVNSYGTVYVAGYTAATKIDAFCLMPNMNLSNTMSSFTAQNIGAGKLHRVREGYRACLFMTTCFSAVIVAVIFLFGENLLSFLLAEGGEGSAISYGVEYMHIVSLFYMLMGVLFVTNGLLRGAGDMASFVRSSLSNIIFRLTFAYVLSNWIGQTAIAWSIPLGWLAGASFAVFQYRRGNWSRKRAIAQREETL